MKTTLYIRILTLLLVLLIFFSGFAIIFVCKESFYMGWDISSKGFQTYLNLFNPYTVLFGATFVVLSVYLTLQTIRRNQEQSIIDTILKFIDFHHKIIEEMQVKFNTEIQGKEIFHHLLIEFNNIYNDKINGKTNGAITIAQYTQLIKESFDKLYHKKADNGSNYGNLFGYYFKNLYGIFQYIDNTPNPLSKKLEYADLAKYHLSEYEILFLFYDGLVFDKDEDEGKNKLNQTFKQLIERYEVLSALNYSNIVFKVRKNDYNKFYHPNAFGKGGLNIGRSTPHH